jgi:site-specific DNA recombinase
MFGPSNTVRKAAIYIRVSTTEQSTEGYGLEAQKKTLLDYVKHNIGLNLITKPEWIYTDVHTGSDLQRPGLLKLREAVRNQQYDAVLVLKIDRLSRSLQHLLTIFEEMEKHQVSFISLHENIDFRGAIGRLLFQIMGAMAQFERELIKGRTVMGRIASAELGNFTGPHIPFGYKEVRNTTGKGKRIELLQEEQAWVKTIYDWYIHDGLGAGQIAKKLNDNRVHKGRFKTSRHKFSPWTDMSVNTILTNPIYRGEFVANQKDENGNMLSEEKWTIVKVPACVSEITFLQAQMVRRLHRGGNSPKREYLLTGKLWDMTLDVPKAFIGASRTKGGFSYRRKQFAKNNTHYPVFEIPGKQIEDFVWNKLVTAIQDPETFIKTYAVLDKIDLNQNTDTENLIARLRSDRINLELSIARIEEAFESGMYSKEKSEEKIALKSARILELDEEIAAKEQELNNIGQLELEIEKLRSVSEQVKYQIDKYDRHTKKLFCQMFVEKVLMSRSGEKMDYQVSAHVYLRFNPDEIPSPPNEGRTGRSHQQGKKPTYLSETGDSGALDQI